MRAALAIGLLELRQRVRDRSLLIFGVGAPLLLASIISLAFGTSDSFSVAIGVVDDDGSDLSRGITTGLQEGTPDDAPIFFVIATSLADGRGRLDDGELGALIVVPDGFERSLASERPRPLRVVAHTDRALVGDIARAIAEGVASRVDTGRLAVATASAGGAADLAAVAAAAAEAEPAISTVDDFGGGRNQLDLAAYFGPSMAILFLFFTVGAGARSVLAERRMGTLARVRASPIPAWSVLAGKTISTLTLGMLSILVLWGATAALLDASWGRPFPVLLLSVATVLAVAGVGALVTALARTDAQAEQYASMAAFVLALLGGNFVTPGDVPEALQRLSLVTPNGWALRGFTDLAVDRTGVGGIATVLAVLLGMAALAGGLALLRLQRLVRP